MSITKEHAKAAIRRFFCPITSGYPDLQQICFVETFDGKEGKEVAELYGFANQGMQGWINECKKTGKVINPTTGADFKGIEPPLIPGQELFALVLAIVQASGHLSDVIKEDEEFADFSKTGDYKIALDRGKTLLNFLVCGEGIDLQTKIRNLNVPHLSGNMAQIRLLESTLQFKLNDFADYNEMGQGLELPAYLPPPVEAKVDILIPPGAPSQAVIHFGAMPDDAFDPFDPFDPFAPPIGGWQEGNDMLQGAAPYQAPIHYGNDDLELQLAMEASLQEGFGNDDPELARAIAASLQEGFGNDDPEMVQAMAASLQQEAQDPELAQAIAASRREEKVCQENPVPILPAARNAGVHVPPAAAPVPAPAPVVQTPPPPPETGLFTGFRL